YALFFVDVEAQRQRCTRAPREASFSQRGPEKISPYFRKASFALATAVFPLRPSSSRRAAGSEVCASFASIRLSVSVSTRETKNDATEATDDRSLPSAASFSSPFR